ncbi:MAG: RsmB/NOP family class I SAM-dependent RNA methyltransferase [Ignisphaera sp.]
MLLYDELLIKTLSKVFRDKLEEFLNSLTSPGKRYYVRVNTLKTSPEHVVESLRSRGVEVYRDEDLYEAIYFPIKGPYKVAPRDKVVVIDKYAAESVYMGSHLYGPGVITCSRDIERGDTVAIVSENNVVVGEGIAMMSCREMLMKRKGIAVQVTASVYRVPSIRSFPEYEKGMIYPQSLAAMYVAHIVDPRPRELILDVCAAPGGKTSHIVELSRGRVHVIALDHSAKRLENMKLEMDRLGCTPFIEIWRSDSRYVHIDFGGMKVDKIVVDPPCSALGVRPKIYDIKSYRDVVAAAKYQIQFLRSATKLLKRGGVVVYSTCTVTLEENEEIIEKILSEDRCLEPVPIDVKRGSRGYRGSVYGDAFLRFYPHEHDTTGYFIAKLVKRC